MTATQALQQTGLWRGFRVWQRNLDAFRHGWKVEVGGIAVEPFVVLVALGYGLGQYVEDFGGLTYAEFVAPGVIASYAMFHATYDSTFGAYLRMETHHVYEAMLFTPLEPEDIVLGEVIWCASRAALVGFAIVAVAAMFGLVGSPLAVLGGPDGLPHRVGVRHNLHEYNRLHQDHRGHEQLFHRDTDPDVFRQRQLLPSGPAARRGTGPWLGPSADSGGGPYTGSGDRRSVMADVVVVTRAGVRWAGHPEAGLGAHEAAADQVAVAGC